MHEAEIVNTGEKISINPMRSLLNNLLINKVPIETICGGKAVCGRCVIEILEGREYLSPLKEREKFRLAALKAKDNCRLACRTYARRDIRIRIINYKS